MARLLPKVADAISGHFSEISGCHKRVSSEVSDEIDVPNLSPVGDQSSVCGAAATPCCRDFAFNLEKDNKAKNIDQILAYGQCIKAEQRARVGKWVCQVSSTAGMKVGEQRRVISDRISPANENFFVTIKEVSDAEKRLRCDGKGVLRLIDNLDGSHANRCLINYDVELSPSMGQFLGSADTYNFQREHGKFTLYGTNHFSLFEGETGTFLVSLGSCEKLK